MSVWAIADLHLSFGVPDKEMDVFGAHWVKHYQKVEAHWREKITEDDLVLIPGDISWAKQIKEAMPDLQWIDSLPGTKVMIRGNHDYWWSAISKIRKVLPPSIHLIQHDIFEWNDYIIGGARLWDNNDYGFDSYVKMTANPKSNPETAEIQDPNEAERILERELSRLKMSLEQMKDSTKTRIAMTHYPPVSADMQPSAASKLFQQYNVKTCVFGHLHNVITSIPIFGKKDGISYILVAADYIGFNPVKVY